MADKARRQRDLIALVLFLYGLLLAASVLSYNPAELTPSANFPLPESTENLLGEPGQWLAGRFFLALGNAVYVLLAGWFVVVLMLFQKCRLQLVVVRLLGWMFLLLCAAAIAAGIEIGAASSSPLGGGGTIGAWLLLWLDQSFSFAESAILIAALIGLGLLLALDFVFVAVGRTMGSSCQVLLSPLLQFVSSLWTALQKGKAGVPAKEPVVAAGAGNTVTDTGEENEADSYPNVIPIRNGVNVSGPPAVTTTASERAERIAEEVDEPAIVPIIRPAPAPVEKEPDDYELPSMSLLEDPEEFPYEEHDQHLRDRAMLLEKTFKDFDLNVRVVGINTGPVITQYEIALETGLRLQKVTRLADDIALNVKVSSVRMVAPIPGKNTVGVEVPNEHRATVHLKEVILTAGQHIGNMRIPLFLGKDTEGRSLVYDLAEMPHLLIAGRTGTGKSVCLNSIILSILMTRRPDQVKMLMIDPKRAELSEYGQLPHLMHPVVTDMKKAEAILSWAVDEMEKRYDLLSLARVRSIASYNQLSRKEQMRRIKPPAEEEEEIPERLSSIVIIVDEMADLIMMMKREIEGHIIRLAQKSRAAGIHLVVATQKPTVDVITGLIKSNLPARICFQVSSRSDSRVVLDEMGADKLLGKGDLLFLQPGTSTLIRGQGTFVSDDEITAVVEALEGEPEFAEELLQLGTGKGSADRNLHERLRARDEVYESAIEIVVREGRGSVSLLQRALGIGYGRAARLIDFMAEDGIVGPYRGSSARDVLVTPEEWVEMKEAGDLVQKVS